MEKLINRNMAGVALAKLLGGYTNKSNVIVLALPRGGLPVAYEIAVSLNVTLDILIVRKLGYPGHTELAMGAIASGGFVFLNQDIINRLGIEQLMIDSVLKAEKKELARRELLYRNAAPFPKLKDKIVILVDDGIATGASIKVAIKAIRSFNPKEVIVAVPVAAFTTCKEIAVLVDKIICPLQPHDFNAVALWYENFPQIEDSEVLELLSRKS